MDGPARKSSTLPHGHKRPAIDHLENEQRLAKRFNLLDLNQIGKLYAPNGLDAPQRPNRANDGAEAMQLDETKDKVYIYNLDQELSDAESEEEKLIFLPDIEKKLGKIPKSILSPPSQAVTGSEIILYNVPSSLSVPPEHDNVRKAIIESRARAREKQVQDTRDSARRHNSALEKANGVHCTGHSELNDFASDDENAMDIG